MKGNVFNIQRFCVKDGPGIRTVVFLKGCPLDCKWCHNPESKQQAPVLAFYENKCVNCKKCLNVCPKQAILDVGVINREACNLCGQCVNVCCGALEILGEELTEKQVIETLLKDKDFYDNSNGGITISGGEPFFQADFTREILVLAKQNSLHTAIETCGFTRWENFKTVLPYVDLFLFDVKETDPFLHKKYTGVDNKLILENLNKLNQSDVNIILRCPIIPNYNDREEHFKNIAQLSNRLKNVIQIEIMPYHPMGKTKSLQIGKIYNVQAEFATNEQIKLWEQTLQKYTNKKVIVN